METFSLQFRIEKLQNTALSLLHIGENSGVLYADDFVHLNQEIHRQINDLYPFHGTTAEQEAALCLSLLMGYSVSLYANPEDEVKKQRILMRSQKLMGERLPASLKTQLLTICNELS